MSYEEFQQAFEAESDRLFQHYARLSEDELLDLIEHKKWDTNYQIWQAIATNGSKKACQPLYDVVKDMNNDYLHRYHACNALFALAGIADEEFKGIVQYGLNKNRERADQREAIEQLGKIILEDIQP